MTNTYGRDVSYSCKFKIEEKQLYTMHHETLIFISFNCSLIIVSTVFGTISCKFKIEEKQPYTMHHAWDINFHFIQLLINYCKYSFLYGDMSALDWLFENPDKNLQNNKGTPRIGRQILLQWLSQQELLSKWIRMLLNLSLYLFFFHLFILPFRLADVWGVLHFSRLLIIQYGMYSNSVQCEQWLGLSPKLPIWHTRLGLGVMCWRLTNPLAWSDLVKYLC
jgi:hypothetical protein